MKKMMSISGPKRLSSGSIWLSLNVFSSATLQLIGSWRNGALPLMSSVMVTSIAGLSGKNVSTLPTTMYLAEPERQHLHEHGYVVVPEALDRTACARLIAAVDRVDARERTETFGRERLLSFANILPEDGAFLDLLDWPLVFPKVWGILGWNI